MNTFSFLQLDDFPVVITKAVVIELYGENLVNWRMKNMASVPFMKLPEEEIRYEVGNYAEVFCDHDDKNGERVRGWLKGVIVQVDAKMVAVQFQTSVYLTDGWMVPDHILWYPVNSANIRPFGRRKSRS